MNYKFQTNRPKFFNPSVLRKKTESSCTLESVSSGLDTPIIIKIKPALKK
jgi:hypothetical protein